MSYALPADPLQALAHSVVFMFETAAVWATETDADTETLTKSAMSLLDCASLLGTQLKDLPCAPECAQLARDAFEVLRDPENVSPSDTTRVSALCRRAHEQLCAQTGLKRPFDLALEVTRWGLREHTINTVCGGLSVMRKPGEAVLIGPDVLVSVASITGRSAIRLDVIAPGRSVRRAELAARGDLPPCDNHPVRITRREGDRVIIDERFAVTVSDIRPTRARLVVFAPPGTDVQRGERAAGKAA